MISVRAIRKISGGSIGSEGKFFWRAEDLGGRDVPPPGRAAAISGGKRQDGETHYGPQSKESSQQDKEKGCESEEEEVSGRSVPNSGGEQGVADAVSLQCPLGAGVKGSPTRASAKDEMDVDRK